MSLFLQEIYKQTQHSWWNNLKSPRELYCIYFIAVVYQGPNQTNQDSIQAWLKHEEPNSTRQQQEVINQTPSPSEYSLQQDKESGWKDLRIILKYFNSHG